MRLPWLAVLLHLLQQHTTTSIIAVVEGSPARHTLLSSGHEASRERLAVHSAKVAFDPSSVDPAAAAKKALDSAASEAAKAADKAAKVVPGTAGKEEPAPKAASPEPAYEPPAVEAVEAPVMWNHGVASGDPLPDAVILWTRATPVEGAPEAIKVTWEVREADGAKVAAEGTTDARADRDYTVKVDVVGVLKPRVKYLFSFKAGGLQSPEGRFRLPPPRNEPLEKLMYAIFSCSNWRWGHFKAYGAAASYDLDFSLHLGDFIYENGLELYPNDHQAVRSDLDPPHELFTLEDYRRRYALHRGDENTQALSAAAPMIAIWDDHEVANNAWKNGAAAHELDTDGSYKARREAALRAYHEWMPTRIDLHARGEDLWMHSHRSFDFGNLAKLVALEMRHQGRDAQTALTRNSVSEQILDVIRESGYPPKDKTHARFFDVMIRAVKSQVEAARWKPTREMLGFAQRSWMAEQARSFEADGQAWFLVAQPLVMQELLPADHLKAIQQAVHRKNPDAAHWIKQISDASGLALTANGTIAADQKHREMTDEHRNAQVALVSGRHGIPLDFDSWNGYMAAKERLIGILETAGHGKSVIYGGDSHNAWAGAVLNRTGFGVAVEFDCQSVTSPGQEFYRPWATPELEASAWLAANQHLAYTNVHQRGFMIVELNETGHHVEFLAVNTTADASTKAECISALGVLSGHVGLHNATCHDAPPAYVGEDEEPPPRVMIETDFDQPEVTLSKPEEDEFEEFELDFDS